MASSLQKKKPLPEEEVRLRLLDFMINERGFPRSAIVVEREIALLPHLTQRSHLPSRRIDLLAYHSQSMRPLLLIECKAIKLTKRAISQVVGYNHYIQSPYIALANQEELITGWFDLEIKSLRFVQGLPSYEELVENLPQVAL